MPRNESARDAALATSPTVRVDPSWRIDELLVLRPAAAAVLTAYGVDSCCGGPRSIADAAHEDGVELPALLRALDAVCGVEGAGA